MHFSSTKKRAKIGLPRPLFWQTLWDLDKNLQNFWSDLNLGQLDQHFWDFYYNFWDFDQNHCELDKNLRELDYHIGDLVQYRWYSEVNIWDLERNIKNFYRNLSNSAQNLWYFDPYQIFKVLTKLLDILTSIF